MTTILTPVGRMVKGHPMIMHKQYDRNNQPKINAKGVHQEQCFVALAIPKGTEQHWNQTPWGQMIYNAAVAAWPRGEHGAPTFAWKITDGDSTVPNKKGKAPCENEGYPGHWIIGAANGFMPACFDQNHANYSRQCQRPEAFKTGDYIRMEVDIAGNNSTDSPGIYINIKGCELVQAGMQIVTSEYNGAASFGATAAVMPANAVLDPNMAGQVQQPVAPTTTQQQIQQQAQATIAPPPAQATIAPPPVASAPEFLDYNGQQVTVDQLRASGWSDAQIDSIRPK